MGDPYSALGVSPGDSDEDVKKAYRELARKYHPDNYHDNPLSDLAQDKMKEINEAYDTIVKQRERGGTGTGAGGAGWNSGGAGSGGGRLANVRAAIGSGNIALAEQLLAAESTRDGEWNFLMGSVCYRKGWLDEARRYYQTAVNMESGNREYRQALSYMDMGGNAYRTQGDGVGMGGCDCCTSMICADCMCNMFRCL